MNRLGSFCLLLGLIAGCGSHIDSVTPVPLSRLQPAQVQGGDLDRVTIYVDTVPVGAAMVPALQHPADLREVLIPASVGQTVSVFAKDERGQSNTLTGLKVASAPVTPPPPVFTITGRRDPVTRVATFIASGEYVYPGAGSPDKPFQGPAAVAVNLANDSVTSADESICLFAGEFRFVFRALPTGEYKIRITNHQIYGSQSGDSINSVSIP